MDEALKAIDTYDFEALCPKLSSEYIANARHTLKTLITFDQQPWLSILKDQLPSQKTQPPPLDLPTTQLEAQLPLAHMVISCAAEHNLQELYTDLLFQFLQRGELCSPRINFRSQDRLGRLGWRRQKSISVCNRINVAVFLAAHWSLYRPRPESNKRLPRTEFLNTRERLWLWSTDSQPGTTWFTAGVRLAGFLCDTESEA